MFLLLSGPEWADGWAEPKVVDADHTFTPTEREVAAMMSRLFPPPRRVIHIQVHSTGDKTDI